MSLKITLKKAHLLFNNRELPYEHLQKSNFIVGDID